MEFKGLLVVIPHSGTLVPAEIPLDALSREFPRLMGNVDWYTDRLYDFRDMLGNSQCVFPYCSLIVEANRDPENLETSVPVKDVFGEAVYLPGAEPDQRVRQSLCRKYLHPFHQGIRREIARGRTFMLDAHSTLTARGVAENHIELMNLQFSNRDGKPTIFSPDVFIETYANELQKSLPWITVTLNQSEYKTIYGHVCGEHSTPAMTRVGNRVPSILQETHQKLYLNADRTPNIEAMETLRRAFAEALSEMDRKVHRGE